jgi:hypothetical protein
MDILSQITRILTDQAAALSPATIQFWLRLILLLTLPAAGCAWSFLRGYRSVFIQVLVGFVGMLFALSLPLQCVSIPSGLARLWLLVLGGVIVAFMPAALPPLIVPTLGAQQKLRKALYVGVAGLILANLLWRS